MPDIDDEDNVFNFEQPRVPAGKRHYKISRSVNGKKKATFVEGGVKISHFVSCARLFFFFFFFG